MLPTDDFFLGRRVRVARHLFPGGTDMTGREGAIVGRHTLRTMVIVQIDGEKTTQKFHVNDLAPLDAA